MSSRSSGDWLGSDISRRMQSDERELIPTGTLLRRRGELGLPGAHAAKMIFSITLLFQRPIFVQRTMLEKA